MLNSRSFMKYFIWSNYLLYCGVRRSFLCKDRNNSCKMMLHISIRFECYLGDSFHSRLVAQISYLIYQLVLYENVARKSKDFERSLLEGLVRLIKREMITKGSTDGRKFSMQY